jgi:putative flippase GtrA
MFKKLLKKYPWLSQIGKFLVTGFTNTGIDFIVLYLLLKITGQNEGIYTFIFPAISFSVATVNSFFMNRYWTFRQETKKKRKEKEYKDFFQFLIITLGGFLINAGVTYLVSNFIPPFLNLQFITGIFDNPESMQNIWVLFGKACATALSMVWNFTGYKFWVFKK